MRNLFKLKNQERQRGAAVVEFAILLPILIILIAGIIEFSLLLYNQQVITNASREGARASINPINKLDFDSGTLSIETIVTTYCNKLITFGGPNTCDVTNDIRDEEGEPKPFSDREFEDDVTIIVQYKYYFLMPQIFEFFMGDFINPRTLESKTIMKMM